MTSHRRITIDAPNGPTTLAARHLDATEGPVRIGSTVDVSTRSAITCVLGYISKAHGSSSALASTAPLAAGLPLVQGKCPACGRTSLFLGDGGYVTCSIIDCPNPSAADELLCGDAATPLARAEAELADMTRDRNRQQWYVAENDRKRKVQRGRADQAEATLACVRTVVAGIAHTTSAGISDYDIGRHDLAVAVTAVLDARVPAATEATELRTALAEALARLHSYHRVGGGPPLGYQILTPVSPADYNRWTAALRPASGDDPPVQCWHTEAGTPCDWDVCKQPERLAAGDYGTDPRGH